MQPSQQTAERAVLTPPRLPHIEVEHHIFKRLSDLAEKEKISLNALASELIRNMLLFHKKELKTIVKKLREKCYDRW